MKTERSDEMRLAAEETKNLRGFVAVGRFADDPVVERDEGVGGQDHIAWMGTGHAQPLRSAFQVVASRRVSLLMEISSISGATSSNSNPASANNCLGAEKPKRGANVAAGFSGAPAHG
jgi:hypothetical protein